MSLPAWPPAASGAELEALTVQAVDYALAHGLVLRPPAAPRPSTSAVIHAPISLYPSPFPRHCFELAVKLQPIYNQLYANVASSPAFLTRVIGGSVSRVDDFTGALWSTYLSSEREGRAQPWHLGLFRSDYLLHRESDGGWGIRQVEFNTISSSFGPLCTKVSDMHRYLAAGDSFPSDVRPDALPQNSALAALAAGLAAGHEAYLSTLSHPPSAPPVILFVVQPDERNAFDQRLLEYQLLSAHGIRCVRLTFAELASRASLSSPDRTLVLSPSSPGGSDLVVSVVYYRAGYSPTDYPTSQEWRTRLLLDRSSAVNCPSAALQLAGAKKVQQVLSAPGEVERFVSPEDAKLLRESWTEMYPLDDSEAGRKGFALANDTKTAGDFVMKPQREGGGNNIYGLKIPPALAEMASRDERKKGFGEGDEGEPREREGYILMSMIRPPTDRRAVLVRAAPNGQSSERVEGEVISELGIYGVAVFRSEGGRGREGAEVKVNGGEAGFLLRTKASAAEEGGVAVGISCLDSPMLV